MAVGQTPFNTLFKVGQKFHDSLEGLLRHPLIIAGALPTGFESRRGRPVRFNATTGTYDIVIHSRVTAVDAPNGKVKLSAYDGLAVGDTVTLIKSDGSTASATISQLQAPAYDPISTLQTNEDFIVLTTTDANGNPIAFDATGVVYLAPAGADLNTVVSGILYEDGTEPEAPVAVEVDGAKVEHVFGADISAIASKLGFKVVDGLVFFRI